MVYANLGEIGFIIWTFVHVYKKYSETPWFVAIVQSTKHPFHDNEIQKPKDRCIMKLQITIEFVSYLSPPISKLVK